MKAIVVSIALLIVSSGQLQNDEDFNEEYQRQSSNSSLSEKTKAEKVQTSLAERPWLLQNSCYAELPLPTNETIYHCTTPAPDLSCFGMPIDYVYVPSRETLPVEYEVLRRFPKCWIAIGPMLCGIVFRPCTVAETEKKEATEIQHGKGEFWQRFEASACRIVIEECEDAIKERVFPSDLVNCSRSAGNNSWKDEKNKTNGALARFGPYRSEKDLSTEWELQTFFTEDKCKYPYQKVNSPLLEPMQCIFPLVYTDHARIRPVIDKCFLPCRNPLISSHATFISFSIFRAIVCFALAAICLAIFLYLACRSSIFVDSDAVFSMAFCLLSFSVYFLCWGAGSIPFLAEASECTLAQHGVTIRNTLLDSNRCFLISAITHVSLLSSIGFVAASYALSAAATSKADARENERDTSDSSSYSCLRFCLVIGIVIVSSSIGMIAFKLNMMSTDGVAGVCSIGLHSILDQLLVVAVPGLMYCLMALCWGAWYSYKATKNREAEIEEKIEEAIAQEKSKMKAELKKEGAKREEKEEDPRDGEDEILVLNDEEEMSDDKKKQLSERVHADLRAEWRDRKQRAYRGGISSKHALVSLCLCLYSLIFGLFVHSITLANDGTEETEAVLGYVRCVMTRSILSKDLRWMHSPTHAAEVWANGTAEADPFVRRDNLASDIDIDTCVYPSSGGFRRMFGLLFVFIVLPMLPIGVFIWAFIAGCTGVGGMVMVKKQRQKATSANFDDVEMMALTTEHFEDHDHRQVLDMADRECKSKSKEDLESGQLIPRVVFASCPLEVDADSLLLHSAARRILSGAISSDQSSISEVEKIMIRNMKRFITQTLNEADERGVEVPQRLQLLQEELVLRALPRDEASGSGADNQLQEQQSEIFVDVLNAARSSLLQPFAQDPVFGDIANRGMRLSGQTIALARLANSNGTINSRSINYFVLQLAINRIHQLAYHLMRREAPTPELIADIETAIRATFSQMDLNCMANADELLTSQQSLAQFDFDVNDDEGVQERIKLYVEAYNEQPPELLEQLINDIVTERNRRYASLLMARQRERRFAAAASALEQHQRMQIHHVDQRLPLDEMGDRPTLLEQQEDLLRQYRETQLQPLHCTGPSTSNGDTEDSSSDVFQFMSHVMRMNGRSMPAVQQTGHSTVLSTGSINGRTAPPVRHSVPLVDDMQQPTSSSSAVGDGNAAEQQNRHDTNIPRLFPWLGDDGGQLSPVPVFPGARSTTRVHLTHQELQDRMAAVAAASTNSSAATEQRPREVAAASASASAAAEPKAPQDTARQLQFPDVPDGEMKTLPENRKKRKAVALEEDGCAAKRESPSPPAAAVKDELMHEHHQQPGSSNGLMTMLAEALVPSERGGREAADDAEDDVGSGSEENGSESPTLSILNQNFVQLEIGEDGEGNYGIPDDDVVAKDEMMVEEIAEDGGEEEEEKSCNDEERLQPMKEKHSNTDIVMVEGEEKEEEDEVEEEEQEENDEEVDEKEVKENEEEEEEEEEEQQKEEKEEENKMKMENEQREDKQRKQISNIGESEKQQIDRDSGIVEDVVTGGSQSDVSISSMRPGETVIHPSESEARSCQIAPF